MTTKKKTPPGKRKSRILLVEDHPIMREGFAQLINHEPDLQVCGQAGSAPKAMESIQALQPDMAIVDISLKGTNGIELIKNLKAQYPSLPVLALSMHDESLYAERVLRAGAKGYVMKQEPTEKVMMAIRQVLDGDIFLSDAMRSRMLRKFVSGTPPSHTGSDVDRLSDRELEVFQMIGSGKGTRQIANELHLSIKTVETYRAHIKEKLNLNDSMELVHLAVQWVDQQQALT